MANTAYIGLVGCGKSYEAVSSVIIPGLAAGRRVVSNIAGLSRELINKHIERVHKVAPDKIGELVVVQNEDVTKEDFFYDEKLPEVQSTVKLGDLVVIDEVWQFWGSGGGCKVGDNAMQFFRMHRHYVDPTTGVASDVVLLIQDLSSLHRSIRAVVELTVKMTKLKTLGLSKSYRVELYEGSRVAKGARFDYRVNKYDKAIFPLYQSYGSASGSGKEVRVDSRQNVLLNKRLWFIAAGALLAVGVAQHYVREFFSGRALMKNQALVDGKAAPASGPVLHQADKFNGPPLSKAYRVAGFYRDANGGWWAVLSDAEGRLRVESPSVLSGRGLAAAGLVEGERVTTFTGVLRASAAGLVAPGVGVAK